MALPIEFTLEALETLEDLPKIARQLTHLAELGRTACGQSDPLTLELLIEGKRLLYRMEVEQIVVLAAEHVEPFRH